MRNFFRKPWRLYLFLYSFFFQILFLSLVLLGFPFLCFLALLARNKGEGYFIGIQELCSNVFSTAEALRLKGKKNITSFAIVNKFNIGNSYRYQLASPIWLENFNNLKELYFFIILLSRFVFFLFKNKYFIFYWNRTFLPMNIDLILLKIAQKKIVIFHCGDDVRYRPIHNKLLKAEGVQYSFPLLEDTTPNLTFMKKFYYQKLPSFLNIPIYTLMDIETFIDKPLYQFRVPQISNIHPSVKEENKIPIIVHAPSNRELKGTEIVLEAMELLRSEGYKFEFILLENLPNEEVMRCLHKADIIIDQPGLWAGRLAMEGFAYSCIVIGGNDSHYEQGNIQLPTIVFKRNHDDLLEKIKTTLLNITTLRNDFYQCYHKFYSADAFINHLEDVLENRIFPDLYPPKNHKKNLLAVAENGFQRLIIKIFIKG